MKSEHKQENIRHYLLGQASPEDSSWLEEELLAEGVLFQELLVVEDELIDQYLRHKLHPNDRQSFETHFLQAEERQQKLRFGRALHKYLSLAETSAPLGDDAVENLSDEDPNVAKPSPKKGVTSFLPFSNPIVSYSMAAAILLVAVGASWLVLNHWRKQTQTQPGNVYAVTLTPGFTRGSGELKRVSIPLGISTVELKLVLRSPEDRAYRAELLTSNGESVSVVSDLKAQKQDNQEAITLTVPTRLLKRDDYQLMLSARQNDGSYQEIDRYQFRLVE